MPAQERDQLINTYGERFRKLAGQASAGDITWGDFQITMREDLRMLNKLQVVAAQGVDPSLIGSDDWLKLGNILKSQYSYLEDFVREAKAGNLTDAQAAARAELYANSSRATYWAQVTKDVELPAQPGDGSTECMMNCKCSWQKKSDGWYWRLGVADHCDDCVHRADDWAPYQAEAA